MNTCIAEKRNDVSMLTISYIYNLIEKTESHVVVGFFFWLFFFLFFLFFSCSCTTSSWSSTTGCRSSSNTGSYIGDEIFNIAAFKSFGKKTWPIWFYINACCLKDGLDLFTRDGNIVISQNKCGVDTCKFTVGHCRC